MKTLLDVICLTLDFPNFYQLCRYDQIKQKKYIPIFKTDTAIDIEYQKQLNCLHGLSNIVQKIRSEHKDNSNLQTATATLEMTIEDKVMQKQSY
jgi:hypothetical protein